MTFPHSDFPRPGFPVHAYLLESQLDVWALHGVCTGREVPTQNALAALSWIACCLRDFSEISASVSGFVRLPQTLSAFAGSVFASGLGCECMQKYAN